MASNNIRIAPEQFYVAEVDGKSVKVMHRGNIWRVVKHTIFGIRLIKDDELCQKVYVRASAELNKNARRTDSEWAGNGWNR